MKHVQIKSITFRVTAETMEAAEIMAALRRQSLSEYVSEALQARLSEDVPDNIAAYEAVRAARQKAAQEKGA